MTLASRRPQPGGPRSSAVARPDQGGTPAAVVEAVLLASTRAVPGVRHVSISVLERGGATRTLAATGELSRRFDELQFTLREGPSIDALGGLDPVVALSCDDPEHRARWPEVNPRAATLGLTGALAVRLAWEGKTLGVLTLSSDQPDPLPEHTVGLATAFAAQAAATLAIARKVEQLELALITRQEIGQAVGILMERYGLTADSAFAYLRRLSQDGNVKLRDLAEQLRLTGRLPEDGRNAVSDRATAGPVVADGVRSVPPPSPSRDTR
jgi:hypothetical protein